MIYSSCEKQEAVPMEDKTFELLEKMYSEFSEFRKETNTRFDNLESGQKKLESGQAKIEVSIEHDIKPSLQALHERAACNTAKLDGHTQRLETVENKLDYLALSVNSHDKRLEVVEALKRAK
jgi:hypothetical protein